MAAQIPSIKAILASVNPGHSRTDLQNSTHAICNQTARLADIITELSTSVSTHHNSIYQLEWYRDEFQKAIHVLQLSAMQEKATSDALQSSVQKLEWYRDKFHDCIRTLQTEAAEEKAKLVSLQAELKMLEAQKVAQVAYNTKIQAIDSSIVSLTTSSTQISTRLETSETNITSLATSLSQETSARTALTTRLTTLEPFAATVREQQQAIMAMRAQIEERKVAIEEIQKQMANSIATLIEAIQSADASSRLKVSTLEEATKLQAVTNETFINQISTFKKLIAENAAELDKEKAKIVSLTAQVGALNDQKVAQSTFDEKVMGLESALTIQGESIAKIDDQLKTDEKRISELEKALVLESSSNVLLKTRLQTVEQENAKLRAKVRKFSKSKAKITDLESKLTSLIALVNSNQASIDADVKVISGSLQRSVGVIEDRLGEVSRQFDIKLNQRDDEITELQESLKTLRTLSTARSKKSVEITELPEVERSSSERTPSPSSKKRISLKRSTSRNALVEN